MWASPTLPVSFPSLCVGITYTTGFILFTLCGRHLHYRCHSLHSMWASPTLPVSFPSFCVGITYTTSVIPFTLCGHHLHYQCHSLHSVWASPTLPVSFLPTLLTTAGGYPPPPPPPPLKKQTKKTPLPLNCDISITYHPFRAKVTSQTNVTQKVLQIICHHLLITS